ncbi:hypothetical protein URS_1398 [Acinetobacter ursingii]|nr:hypothetical protein URS_1398 [Acinetobacter ursingii]
MIYTHNPSMSCFFSIAQQPQSAVNVGLHSVQKDHFIIRLSLNKRLELQLLPVVVKGSQNIG